MSLWKRGRRYWTIFEVHGELFRKPLVPPGERFATTDHRLARTLEKDLIDAAQDGKLERRAGPSRLFEACDVYLEAKRATANTQRAVEIDADCLKAIRRVIGDVPLKAITRETIERFQATRRSAGKSNRTVNMEVGALRKVLKRFRHWRRLEDDVQMLTESKEPTGRVLDAEDRVRLFEVAQSRPSWQHVYCAAVLAANSSMRGGEIKHLRRQDVYLDKRVIHIRRSKNETSRRIIPLNDPALDAVRMMVTRADELGHTAPEHYLWCAMPLVEKPASKVDYLTGACERAYDPTAPMEKWDNAWRALRKAAGLPWLRFHDLRHTVITELLEAGEPDHVVESITGHLSKRMLQHYSHIRNQAKKGALDRLAEARTRVGNSVIT